MQILVLFLPLYSAIICGLFGRRVGVKGSGWISVSLITSTWLISCAVYYEAVLNGSTTYVLLWRWFDSGVLTINVGLQYDVLSSTMLLVVTGISALVHLYSLGYMRGDPHIPRFMAYLSLFTFCMVVLITADNYIQLFIGWEGVGLCSYLLVNYWVTRLKASQAAVKAMLVNRVGDIGLVLGMLVLINEYGTLEFTALYAIVGSGRPWAITVASLMLFIGAIGKSAQLGLHTWLPDAMEGPTPVSALIHAATMVTAGVFLLIRSGPLLECSPVALQLVGIVGAMTTVFAATVGLVQYDMKRVVAYSTCSQLGYMVMVCGLSGYSVSLFHLVNHACFKALLFLSAGAVLHAVRDEQDMRKMGGLVGVLPFTYTMVLIGSLSLMGFPYLSGFYSKDLILELAYFKYNAVFAYWLGSCTALLTAFYSMRLVYLTFISSSLLGKQVLIKSNESDWTITWPLGILAAGSIGLGYLGKEVILSGGIDPIVPGYVQIMPLLLSLLGAIMAYGFYTWVHMNWMRFYSLKGADMYYRGYTFLTTAWQFNYIINHIGVLAVLKFGHTITYRVIDRGLLEMVGPLGLSKVLKGLTQRISGLQSGLVLNYLLVLVAFAATLIIMEGWI